MVHNSSEALPIRAESPIRLVALGYDQMLVGLRSRVLRMSGYEVEEKFTMTEASESAQSDLIDALVICHSVPNEEKEQLVRAVRNTRKLMPIFCIRTHQYDPSPNNCISVDNSPVAILDSVREAVRAYKSARNEQHAAGALMHQQ